MGHRFLGLCLVAGACSTVPEATFPAFAEHNVTAEYLVSEDGRLRVPASTQQLVVHALVAEPQPEREQFGANGERWFVYPAGTSVRVHCLFRAYAVPGGRIPAVADVLPGAVRIQSLERP
ncbi:MAG: hypothetical protein ABIP94_06980 [Planctomycetota bacterium]